MLINPKPDLKAACDKLKYRKEFYDKSYSCLPNKGKNPKELLQNLEYNTNLEGNYVDVR